MLCTNYKNKIFCIAILLILLANVGCAKDVDETKKAPVPGNTILIENYAFDPPLITIEKGEMVVWENMDKTPHKISWDGMESHELVRFEEFKYTFRKSGTYTYTCSLHKEMTGKIIVRD